MSWWCLIAGRDDAPNSSPCWSPSTDSLNQFRRLQDRSSAVCWRPTDWKLCYTFVRDSHKPTCLKCVGLNLLRIILEITVYATTVRIRAATTNSEPPVITTAPLRCPGNRWQERGEWAVTHQVYGFSSDFRGVVAPGLTPQPLLWERLDGHLVDHVVGEVLQTDGKLRKPLASFNKRILYLCRVPGPGWTGCWGLGWGLDTGLVIGPRLQPSGTSLSRPRREHWQQRRGGQTEGR